MINTLFLRDPSCYQVSLALGMEFLHRAVIDDPDDPDDRSIRHMYHVELGGWNRPYMELAGQVVREAFLPYADYTGDEQWYTLARAVIVDGVLAHAACTDPASPAYGLLHNCADPLCDYGSPLDGEEMVKYRLDQRAYLAAHPGCRRAPIAWYTFDSAEILLAAILLNTRRRESALDEFIDRSLSRFTRLLDEYGAIPQCYDERDGQWHRRCETTTHSRLLWAAGLLRQAGRSEVDGALLDRIAAGILEQQQPNGIILTNDPGEPIVAEFVIYCIEGLYWGGTLLGQPAWMAAARRSFDTLLAAPHILAGTPYFWYNADWSPHLPWTDEHSGISQEMHHMSVTGQMARLAWLCWKDTGEERYLGVYQRAIDLLYCQQDRRSTGPAHGGMPRSVNMPWWREICPVYTYASALIPGLLAARMPA